MKRNLDKNKHQMTEWEKENLWLAIEEGASAKAGKNRSFGLGWLRATGGATVLAAMVLTVFMWTDNQKELVGPEKMVPSVGIIEAPRDIDQPSTPEPSVAREEKTETIEEKNEAMGGLEKEKKGPDDYSVDVITMVETGPDETNVEETPSELDAAILPKTFEKFAIDSLEEGISKQAGVSPVPARVTLPSPGSVTGGETPPNGEKFELMYFEHTGVNPFLPTEEDSLSTFAVDVDNASWNLTRSYLNRGSLPPKSAIRVEEFVNAFKTGFPEYRRPKDSDEAFAIHVDGIDSPFGKGYQLMRVGLVGETVDPENRKPASLIFVIDTSGSMRQENRLETVKDALNILLDELQEGDTVGIVTYGSHGVIVLNPTDIGRRATIAAAIENLQCGGSTNAEESLQLAYRMGREHYQENIINRLILCSDGVANVGGTDADRVLGFVRTKADEGIALSTIGFGMGNYNDVFMEKLADKGDGNYYYVDTLKEAKRVFKENLTGTLQTIAQEVKIQVAFNPETVERWRLLGYENRDVADEDFRNDNVDAGEIGAGHQVTALYEIKLKDGAGSKTLGTVRVRHEGPAHDAKRAGIVTELSQPVFSAGLSMDDDPASLHLQVQILVAEFAEILRGSYWAKGHELQDLVPLADKLARQSGQDEQIQDLAAMIRKAASLAAEVQE